MLTVKQAVPLSLYIHIPWCVKKCPYCDFNSHPLRDQLPEQDYIDVLIKDLDNDLTKIQKRKLTSIFIGGGTPSLFSASAIKKLLQAIDHRIPFVDDIEITLEANPGTVEQEKFIGFKEAGVNRLSIGCQSFNNDYLKKLGRIHGSNEAIKAAQAATNAGFDNFNLDLMFGLPNQSIADAIQDLQTAIILNPSHISWYQLTLEPNTLFYKQPPPMLTDDLIAEMQEAGKNYLKENNFSQYEVSAYSKENKKCQHNRNYWEFGDYLAIGAGAHGKITDLNSGDIIRYMKHKHPKKYLTAENYIAEEKKIANKELVFEFMLNALRLQEPISKELFEARTGLVFSNIEDKLIKTKNKGLIILEDNHFYPTPLGRLFLNDLLTEFLC